MRKVRQRRWGLNFAMLAPVFAVFAYQVEAQGILFHEHAPTEATAYSCYADGPQGTYTIPGFLEGQRLRVIITGCVQLENETSFRLHGSPYTVTNQTPGFDCSVTEILLAEDDQTHIEPTTQRLNFGFWRSNYIDQSWWFTSYRNFYAIHRFFVGENRFMKQVFKLTSPATGIDETRVVRPRHCPESQPQGSPQVNMGPKRRQRRQSSAEFDAEFE